MKAKEQLKQFKALLDPELEKYLNLKIKEAKKISPHAEELARHIYDLTMRGGKRIRPSLTYYSYIACGGKNLKDILCASMAIELSETYLLIHDDIMDNDSLRRGGMTIHESYLHTAEEKYSDSVNAKDFGQSMAINAGDLACAMSNEILAESKFKPALVNKAILEFNQIYTKEIYGQTLDVHSQLREDIKPEDVILTHQYKTVPYTFDGPIRIGAILAGADGKVLDKLSKYTVPLGTAFQIQDDILGMFGTEEKLGKPITSDLREGKKTLLIVDSLAVANKQQKEIINLNLGNLRASYAGLQSVRKVITDTGALEKSKELAEKLVAEAMEAIESVKLKKFGKEYLINLADYMIKREY